MGSRGYQDLNLRVAANSPYNLASTDYIDIFFDAADTYPSGVVTAALVENEEAYLSGATSGSSTFDLIIPAVYDSISTIDGTITGNLLMGVSSSGANNSYTTLTSVDLNIKLIDSTGASTTAFTGTIWTGSIKSEYDAGEDPKTLQTRYWIDVEDVRAHAYERIVISYTYNYTIFSNSQTGTSKLRIHCTNDTEETSISLPFILS